MVIYVMLYLYQINSLYTGRPFHFYIMDKSIWQETDLYKQQETDLYKPDCFFWNLFMLPIYLSYLPNTMNRWTYLHIYISQTLQYYIQFHISSAQSTEWHDHLGDRL